MKYIKLLLVILSFQVCLSAQNNVYWWNDAVFYEIFVRSYYDSNGNGIGDFKGLTQKIEYLHERGSKNIPLWEFDFQEELKHLLEKGYIFQSPVTGRFRRNTSNENFRKWELEFYKEEYDYEEEEDDYLGEISENPVGAKRINTKDEEDEDDFEIKFDEPYYVNECRDPAEFFEEDTDEVIHIDSVEKDEVKYTSVRKLLPEETYWLNIGDSGIEVLVNEISESDNVFYAEGLDGVERPYTFK